MSSRLGDGGSGAARSHAASRGASDAAIRGSRGTGAVICGFRKPAGQPRLPAGGGARGGCWRWRLRRPDAASRACMFGVAHYRHVRGACRAMAVFEELRGLHPELPSGARRMVERGFGPLAHLLYRFRLPYTGFEHARVVLGGEKLDGGDGGAAGGAVGAGRRAGRTSDGQPAGGVRERVRGSGGRPDAQLRERCAPTTG